MNTRTILALLAVLGFLLASCGPTPKGWDRDDSAATQCTELGEKAPAHDKVCYDACIEKGPSEEECAEACACEYCCNQANAAGHVWKKDTRCECL